MHLKMKFVIPVMLALILVLVPGRQRRPSGRLILSTAILCSK